ncbi:MAG: efflux transporter outer membrane subunit, partial [Pseudomonadota bacterium]|nr:efflux transporter outer membrane subunit [Pseudomonadota bacterium]
GDWWRLFADDELNRLAAEADRNNQTVAQSLASYEQAQALVRQARASLFPSLGVGATSTRSGGSRGSNGAGGRSGPVDSFGASLSADWQPDFWGRVGAGTAQAAANAEAIAADLAGARLSAQGALAIDYFSLREADAEAALIASTIEGYQRALQITQNRYAAGVIAKTDVLQAQTVLFNAQADLAGVRENRARFEHAIAVLVGKAPAEFNLPAAPWNQLVPAVPLGVPSALLQRRPDIAANERAVAAANAQIGIERAAYFPNFTLSASGGPGGSRIGQLFSATGLLWSIGVSVSETIFDGGLRGARVDAARAARDLAAARYRQNVLTAFQAVEDQLATTRSLAEQNDLRRQASDAADQTEQQILNRYRAGQVGYTDVVTAQASALGARRSLVNNILSRQASVINLVTALGGGWDTTAPVELKGSARADNVAR